MRPSAQRRAEIRWAAGHPAVLLVLVLAIAATTALAVTWGTEWAPAAARHARAENALAAARADLRHLRSIEGRVERYRHNRRALEVIDERLAADASQAALARGLTELARRHRIEIVGESSREGETTPSGLAPLHQTLELRGRYASIRQLVTGVESLPTLTLVRECHMARARSGDGIAARLELITYRRRNGGASG